MTTKRFNAFVAAMAVIALSLTLTAQAQTPQNAPPPPQQTVNGSAGVNVYGITGDPINGGDGFASGAGSFAATDPNQVSGNAATTGIGSSSQVVGPNKATSTANGTLNTLVTTAGATDTITLYGSAGQGNWAGVTTDPANYSNAGNSTNGYFNSTDTTTAPLIGTGMATGQGDSVVTVNGAGTPNATSTDKTTGTSQGVSGFTTLATPNAPSVSSGVSGAGVVNAESTSGNPNSGPYAQGWNTGGATYQGANATGPETGSLTISGANNAATGAPGNVSASSVVSATSKVGH